MLSAQFIKKWHGSTLTERAASQSHFLDLCAMLGVDKPSDVDLDGKWYAFEKGAKKTGGGDGWADVWRRGCFAWEYKGKHKDLNAAFAQLQRYAIALENPPLLVVSDMETIIIHSNFTNTLQEIHTIALEDMGSAENLQKLKWLFTEPERFKPGRTTFAVTEEAATKMGLLAQRLTDKGNDPLTVAHFLIQCVFCMFAEDARLLPEKLFETVLDKSNPDGAKAQSRLTQLFTAMQIGGDFALNEIPWFNGGLFAQIEVPELQTEDVVSMLESARMDWSAIEPAILGTLFERGLNPDMRSQLGAHYTDPGTILKIVLPVVETPLQNQWAEVRSTIETLMDKHQQGGRGSKAALNNAQAAFIGFIEHLKEYRVLDPACGSGNFLYLSLKALKDLEHRANLDVEALGLHRELDIYTSPANVMGIELNPYAAELARITVWIGEIQWMINHGYPVNSNPILKTLDHIECRDALLNPDGSEAEWPPADAIVGNPPFLGGSKKRRELGGDYFDSLSAAYRTRVPDGADLVCYWFDKARVQIEQGTTKAAGLVATNSIRGGSNRKVLENICANGSIFEAWSDEEWINEGAAVRVSLVCFSGKTGAALLDELPVTEIHADLTAGGGLNLTLAKPLPENAAVCFMGSSKKAPFDISGQQAREWLKWPNPNGRSNCEVVRPLCNAIDIMRRNRDTWIVDFGTDMSEADAALYEIPFQYVVKNVKPISQKNSDRIVALNWWRMARPRWEMRTALADRPRYIATPAVAKHRTFVWLDTKVLPDQAVLAIARSDDTTFGILHSRFHELWALRTCTYLGVGNDPRYTPTTTFETFPFPEGLTPKDQAEYPTISAAAHRLDELRNNWLNPPEWVEWVRSPEEVQAGYPLRPVAKPGHESNLKKRTLTNLYNLPPAWLDNAHKELDAAVAAAYGWTDYSPEMPDEEILRRLLKLNLERAALQ